MKSGLLKNATKFNNIKLAKGMILSSKTLHYTRTKIESGVSTTLYKKMIKLPSGNAVFKNYSSDYLEFIDKVRAVNEMLVYELCKQTNVPCAKYEPATIDEKTGLVSYNVAKESEKVLSMNQLMKKLKFKLNDFLDMNSVNRLLSCAVENDYKIEDRKQILHDLYKMIIIDNLTMQTDRNLGNIHFIVDKQNNIKSCPMIDNELAFAGKILNFAYDDFPSEELPSYMYLYRDSMFTTNFALYRQQDFFSSTIKFNVEYAFLSIDKQFRRDLYNILKNIDIDKAIQNVEKLGYEINDDYKTFVKEIINYTRNEYKEAYNAYKSIFQTLDDDKNNTL